MRDSAGATRAVSPTFEVVTPPRIFVSKAAYNAIANKGDTCRVEWEYTGVPSTVRAAAHKKNAQIPMFWVRTR